MSTIYASFAAPGDAERAAGAMLDHGAVAGDLSILANEKSATGQPVPQTSETMHAEKSAKSGISTTTPMDVAAGTVKGATIGIGVGALAAVASLFIPGLGLVVGGGALAAAFMGGAGTAIAGAAAGGVAGFLADQGVPEEVVTRYSSTFEEGGTILAIAVPSGKLEASDVEGILTKYGAANIATVNASRPLAEGATLAPPDPLVVQGDNPDIAPVMYAPPAPVVVATPMSVMGSNAADPLDDVTVVPVEPTRTVVDTAVQPMTPEPMVDVIDPISGQVIRRPVETVIPDGEDSQITTLTPNAGVVEDRGGNLHQTVGRPVTISEQPVVVTDSMTGRKRAAKIVEDQHAVVGNASEIDEAGHVNVPIDGPEQTVIAREKHIEYQD
jgi:hypothetical protein